jgi:hypothetical protein
MPGFARGEKVEVRYIDTGWYPAIIIELIPRSLAGDPDDGDRYRIRWDPLDPNIRQLGPPTKILSGGEKNDAAVIKSGRL